MSHREIRCGWYSVYIDNPHDVEPIVDVDKLAEALPHGNGIDGDWYITVNKCGSVHVSSEYHRMNDVGYYDGWVPFSFRLYHAKKTEERELIGPCAGQVQTLYRRGDLVARYYLRQYETDHLFDAIDISLRDAGIHPAWSF